MTDHEIDALVTAANPIDERELGALPLGHVEIALREAVLRSGGHRPAASRRPARRLPSRRLLAGLAVAALAAVGLVALTGRDPGPSGTAWAAPLVHLAESSPLLLLDRPGWSVTRADETDEVEGEMTFMQGASHRADLHWRRGPLEQWQRDRAKEGSQVVHRTVLGHRAQLSQYAGSTDFTAIWPEGSRVLEFRAVTADLAAFEQLLGSLKRVDVDTWLSALPASVVKSANRAVVVTQMLADIPVPPGFDAASLESEPTVSDRYQLGAKVTGAVACEWIARWDAARKRGDTAAARAALDAMQTSHRWKVLDEMRKDGAWPEVLVGYADAMRGDGRGLTGASLAAEVRFGLGCGGG
jgi:hypothetical protein